MHQRKPLQPASGAHEALYMWQGFMHTLHPGPPDDTPGLSAASEGGQLAARLAGEAHQAPDDLDG